MTQLSKILVVVGDDYDRRALIGEISAIAGTSGSNVTLLGITDPPALDPDTLAALSRLYEQSNAAQLELLSGFRAELQQAGISAMILQAAGKPYETIIRAASAGGFDLVMKAAASSHGSSGLLFGSTDMQLFRLSPDPVWIFKPTPANRLARVMAAVDLLAFDKEKSALADKVIRWGKAVAEQVDAELHVLHVWDLHHEIKLRGQVGRQAVDRLLEALEQRHRQWLDDAIARSQLDAHKIAIHFLKGDAEESIPLVAQAQKADLLVMGTVGRTGIPGFFIGNTADSVLRRVNCSVLAIKPEGFQTPVDLHGPA